MNLTKLRAAFKQLRLRAAYLTKQNDELEEENLNLMRQLKVQTEILSMPGNEARNLLFHTRVHGMSDQRGIGYGVTVFVRDEVLAVIRSDPSLYGALVQTIAGQLAERAVRGMLVVNSRGQNCALLFESRAGGAIGNVFDTPLGAGIRRAIAPGQSVEEYRAAESKADDIMRVAELPPVIPPLQLKGTKSDADCVS